MSIRNPVWATFAVFMFWFAVVVASALAEEPVRVSDEIGTALVCNNTPLGVVCYEH